MTNQHLISKAYRDALMACSRARTAGKRYVALQCKKGGSYRLVAVTWPGSQQTSFSFEMTVTDWAKNVVYRLRECCFLPVDVDEIDSYFDAADSKILGKGGEPE